MGRASGNSPGALSRAEKEWKGSVGMPVPGGNRPPGVSPPSRPTVPASRVAALKVLPAKAALGSLALPALQGANREVRAVAWDAT